MGKQGNSVSARSLFPLAVSPTASESVLHLPKRLLSFAMFLWYPLPANCYAECLSSPHNSALGKEIPALEAKRSRTHSWVKRIHAGGPAATGPKLCSPPRLGWASTQLCGWVREVYLGGRGHLSSPARTGRLSLWYTWQKFRAKWPPTAAAGRLDAALTLPT